MYKTIFWVDIDECLSVSDLRSREHLFYGGLYAQVCLGNAAIYLNSVSLQHELWMLQGWYIQC